MWQISDFFTEVKKSRNLVTIARNMLPSITMLTYANRSNASVYNLKSLYWYYFD